MTWPTSCLQPGGQPANYPQEIFKNIVKASISFLLVRYNNNNIQLLTPTNISCGCGPDLHYFIPFGHLSLQIYKR